MLSYAKSLVIVIQVLSIVSADSKSPDHTGDPIPATDPSDIYSTHEQSFERVRQNEGDDAYLRWFLHGELLVMADIEYPRDEAEERVCQEHPSSEETVQSRIHAREFLIRRQMEYWAAAYKFRDVPEFAEAGAVENVTSRMKAIYISDLYIQKEVQRLKRLYSDDGSEVFAGVTGAEVIAYMGEHLPDPDPRALLDGGSSDPPTGAGVHDPGSGTGSLPYSAKDTDGLRIRTSWIWFVALAVISGAVATWYLRNSRPD